MFLVYPFTATEGVSREAAGVERDGSIGDHAVRCPAIPLATGSRARTIASLGRSPAPSMALTARITASTLDFGLEQTRFVALVRINGAFGTRQRQRLMGFVK
jgi:hypothetical protein